jgi:cellulose synthase/poly-beta-1,6-N-acetylglucosamine synthase-like glycosyltransferase
MRAAPAALAVIVPAHNEELLVRQCLESVRTALAGTGLPSVIVLVAHRCTDRTVEFARSVLSGPDERVLLDGSPTVATARAAGVTQALAAMAAWPQPRPPAGQCWLLSTDADSVVPPTWVADLHRYLGSGAAAVAGLVEVHGWEGASPAAREAYRAILAAGMRMTQHDHVYAANLAVRLDAYLDVGGWPNHVPGEDAALLAALRARGWPVVGARDVRVRTSGRRAPRAGGGLGSLLDRLATEGMGSPLDVT